MSTASSVTPSPQAGREKEVKSQYLDAGQNMSAPLQGIHDRAQARGDMYSNTINQMGQFAGQYGNAAASYGGKAYDSGMAGSQNAYSAGQRLEGAGGQGGAIGAQYGGRLTDAGMAGGKAIAQGQAGMYGAADKLNASADRLAGLEATQGPSAAQAQLQSATNKGQAANLAMARSGGGFGGSASRSSQALRQNAAMGQEAANQSAQLKAGEDAAWRQRQASNLANAGNLQSAAGNMYGNAGQLGLGATGQNIQALSNASNSALAGNAQNIGAIQGSGQLGVAGTQLANQGAQTGIQANQAGIQGMNVGGQLAGQAATIGNQSDQLSGQAIAQDSANKKAYNDYLAQLYGISSGVDVAQNQATNAFNGQMIGAGAAALGMMMSDERNKDVGPKVKMSSAIYGNPYGRRGAPGTMSESVMSDERNKRAPDLRSVESRLYEYKDPDAPGAAPGLQAGPMAQDIERAIPGAVHDTPQGKMVEPGRTVLPLLSAVGEQQQEIDRLKRRLKLDEEAA